MRISGADGHEIIVHELMSSPINQLSKRGLSDYYQSLPSTTQTGVNYSSEIDVDTYYSTHSNFMCVQVSGNTLTFEIFRTKKSKPARRAVTITLPT
jgi:hypothetical protein